MEYAHNYLQLMSSVHCHQKTKPNNFQHILVGSDKILSIFQFYLSQIQRQLEDTELSQARSKLDTVDRPVRNACTTLHHYNGVQYCSTETVLSIFPFLQTNIHLRCGKLEVRGQQSIDNKRTYALQDNGHTKAVATVRHKHLACRCYWQLDRYHCLNNNIFY